MLNERIPLIDDIEPVKDEAETDAKLLFHYKLAVGASVALTFILIIAWPFPMMWGLGAFGKGRFTSWVVVEILWALIGGVVIIGLPAYETVRCVYDRSGLLDVQWTGNRSATYQMT